MKGGWRRVKVVRGEVAGEGEDAARGEGEGGAEGDWGGDVLAGVEGDGADGEVGRGCGGELTARLRGFGGGGDMVGLLLL